MAKPATPHAVVLGTARVNIDAIPPRVFAALTNAVSLEAWWGKDVRVEAQVGGRYEGTLSIGRVEGTITAIDGPGTLSFVWPLAREGGAVMMSVAYTLSPRGSQTAVHVVQHSVQDVPGDWDRLWQSVLDALKRYVEASGLEPTST